MTEPKEQHAAVTVTSFLTALANDRTLPDRRPFLVVEVCLVPSELVL